jgi:hypothetical protein
MARDILLHPAAVKAANIIQIRNVAELEKLEFMIAINRLMVR